MQARKSLAELAGEIQRRHDASRDFVAPATQIEMQLENDKPVLAMRGVNDVFSVGKYAGGQIAEKLGIPKRYYDRMAEEAPDLLKHNVNTWLKQSESKHLVRTLDGSARAFLSDGYRPIDNIVVASGVFEEIEKSGMDVKPLSAEITERRMYIQLITHEVKAVVSPKVNDILYAGLTISNSEIGQGKASFASLLYFLICLNGMKGMQEFNKMHIGGRLGNTTGMAVEEFSAKTLRFDDQAFMSAMQDMTRKSLSEIGLKDEMLKLEQAKNHELNVDALQEVVKEVQKKHNLTDAVTGGVFGRLVKGGDFTQFGLSSAITNVANDQDLVPDYDDVIEMQSVGAELMYMAEKDFNAMNLRAGAELAIASA